MEAFVRERFGLIEGSHMMEATEVHLLDWEGFDLPVLNMNLGGKKATFELVALPTTSTNRFWPYRLSMMFGALPLDQFGGVPLFRQLTLIESNLVGYVGSTIAVLVSIVISAFFVPNMLRKGSVDLLLVKPIARPKLLLYNFTGGLTFIFLNTTLAVCGVWLALGLRSGVWAPTFLLTILVLTFYFAILYSISALFGVLTGSPIACILLTCGAWAVFFLVGVSHTVCETLRATDRTARAIHEKLGDDGLQKLQGIQASTEKRRINFDDFRFEENWFTQTIAVLHDALPPINDLYSLTDKRLRHDLALGEVGGVPADEPAPPELPGGIPLPQITPKPPTFARTFDVSAVFIALMLGLSCWRFASRDY